MLTARGLNIFLWLCCWFMAIVVFGYVSIKNDLTYDFKANSFSNGYTVIGFEKLLSHNYTWENIARGIQIGVLIFFYRTVGNYFYKQWFISPIELPCYYGTRTNRYRLARVRNSLSRAFSKEASD